MGLPLDRGIQGEISPNLPSSLYPLKLSITEGISPMVLLFSGVDWPVIAERLGTVIGTVLTLYGAYRVKLMIAQKDIRKEEVEIRKEEVEVNDKTLGQRRKERRDAIDELRQVLKIYQDDKDKDRAEIHNLRGVLQKTSNELAICEHLRHGLERKIERREQRIEVLEQSLKKLGVQVSQQSEETDDE
jgi:hypothetical protein